MKINTTFWHNRSDTTTASQCMLTALWFCLELTILKLLLQQDDGEKLNDTEQQGDKKSYIECNILKRNQFQLKNERILHWICVRMKPTSFQAACNFNFSESSDSMAEMESVSITKFSPFIVHCFTWRINIFGMPIYH